jgi:TPR repeat protein
VERDVNAALAVYKEAADSGSPEAAYSYGYLLLRTGIQETIGE